MTIIEANEYLQLTEEEIAELSALEKRIKESPELTQKLHDAWHEIYVEKVDAGEVEKKYNVSIPEDAFHGLFYILAGVQNLERVIAFYHEKGISIDILKHTLQDVALWIRNFKRYNGYLGLASRYWISLGFAGTLFRLGRMEFEETIIKEDSEIPGLKKGDLALEGHVPQGEPLDHEACMESYRAAFPFFEKYFHYHAKAVHLQTWMLDPELKKILPPTSNILQWQNDVTLFPGRCDSSDIGRFVFGMRQIDLKTAPRDTSLRRKVLEHLEEGGAFYDHKGVILREQIMQE